MEITETDSVETTLDVRERLHLQMETPVTVVQEFQEDVELETDISLKTDTMENKEEILTCNGLE